MYLDSMAMGVTLSDFVTMATTMPGASRSSSGRVASGVTSLGENPVPPVVKMRASFFWSHHSLMTACIAATSSGTIAVHMSASVIPRLQVHMEDCEHEPVHNTAMHSTEIHNTAIYNKQ